MRKLKCSGLRFGFDFKKFRNSVIRECQECPEFEKGRARAEITERQRRGFGRMCSGLRFGFDFKKLRNSGIQ